MFALRSVAFEWDEDMEEVCNLEFVLDGFDKSERSTLETEIKNAKEHRSTKAEYERYVCKWKVFEHIN